MRKYTAIWQKIKTTGCCTVSVHPSLHARLKKAVSKEKYYDTAFKVLWDLKSNKLPELEITYDNTNKYLITFTLIKPITLGDL